MRRGGQRSVRQGSALRSGGTRHCANAASDRLDHRDAFVRPAGTNRPVRLLSNSAAIRPTTSQRPRLRSEQQRLRQRGLDHARQLVSLGRFRHNVVETALARALVLAAEAKRWDVVMQISKELEARRWAMPQAQRRANPAR